MNHQRFLYLLGKKLSGQYVGEEREEYALLLRNHPEWTFLAEQMEDLWKSAPHHAGSKADSQAFEQHLAYLERQGIYLPSRDAATENPKPKPGTTFRKLFLFSAAAIFLTVCGLCWWLMRAPSITETKSSQVFTRAGSKTKVVLPDGSVVWLNAGSNLSYNENFGIRSRYLQLSGEAFFDVKKSTVPFIIHAGQIQIKVLGTAFNVKSYPDEKTTEATLIRGRIEVHFDRRPGEMMLMKPNEKLIVLNDIDGTGAKKVAPKTALVTLGAATYATDSTVLETAWVADKLIFDNERFEDLARRMERWYGVRINIQPDAVREQRLSGTFTSETLQAALEELQMIVHFHFILKSNNVLITQ